MEHASIYKMTNPLHHDKVYYGSTVVPLSKRMISHRCKYLHYLNGGTKYRLSAFDVIEPELNDVILEIIEHCPDVSCRKELRERERFYIENNVCVNKNIPNRSQCESSSAYYFKNKDRIAQLRKEYYINNKEHILTKCREYQAKNIEKFNKYQLNYQRKLREEAKAFREITKIAKSI
jgi:hypothetical protein